MQETASVRWLDHQAFARDGRDIRTKRNRGPISSRFAHLSDHSWFCEIVPRKDYTPMIQAQIERQDVILSHYVTLFEAKQVAQEVHSLMYAKQLVNLLVHAHGFSPEERKRMTLLIPWPEQIESLSEYFGGKWIAVSEPFGDSYALQDLGGFQLLARRLGSH